METYIKLRQKTDRTQLKSKIHKRVVGYEINSKVTWQSDVSSLLLWKKSISFTRAELRAAYCTVKIHLPLPPNAGVEMERQGEGNPHMNVISLASTMGSR